MAEWCSNSGTPVSSEVATSCSQGRDCTQFPMTEEKGPFQLVDLYHEGTRPSALFSFFKIGKKGSQAMRQSVTVPLDQDEGREMECLLPLKK